MNAKFEQRSCHGNLRNCHGKVMGKKSAKVCGNPVDYNDQSTCFVIGLVAGLLVGGDGVSVAYDSLRPPLNKKLFPVHRPGGLKRADWDFFFMIFEKSFFSQSSRYILVNEKLKTEKKKNPDLPTGFFGSHPADRKQFFT